LTRPPPKPEEDFGLWFGLACIDDLFETMELVESLSAEQQGKVYQLAAADFMVRAEKAFLQWRSEGGVP
jgi:hypothetical protein